MDCDAALDSRLSGVPCVSSIHRSKRRRLFCANAARRSMDVHVNRVRNLLNSNEMLKFTILGKEGEGMCPAEIILWYVQQAHSALAHPGIKILYNSVRRDMKFEHAFSFCVYVCSTCAICARIKAPHGAHHVSSPIVSELRNDVVYVDTADSGIRSAGPGGQHLAQVRIDCTRNKRLGVSVLNDKGSEEQWRVFLRDHIVPYGCPPVVRTDPGDEFKGAFEKGLQTFGAVRADSCVGHGQSNGHVERIIRDFWQALRAELDERGLPPNQWVSVVHIVVDKLNKRATSSNQCSAFEKVNNAAPRFHATSVVQSFLDSVQRGDVPIFTYDIGEKVLFFHPEFAFGHAGSTGLKIDGRWVEMVIERVLSSHVYVVRPTEKNARFSPSYRMTVHANQLRKFVENVDNMFISSAPLSDVERRDFLRKPVAERLAVVPVHVGDFVLYKSSVHNTLCIGCVKSIVNSDSHVSYNVQVHGSYSRRTNVGNKQFHPAWVRNSVVLYSSVPPSLEWQAHIVNVPTSDLVDYGFTLSPEFKLTRSMARTYAKGFEGHVFACVRDSGVCSGLVSNPWDSSTSSYMCMSARLNRAFGRIVDINPRSIKPEDVQGVAQAKQAELKQFERLGVYERIPIGSVDRASANVVPTKWVLNKKLLSEGVGQVRTHEGRKAELLYKYKARLTARGDLDKSDTSDISTAMPPLSSLRALFAFAAASKDFKPEDLQQADVSSAFLQAVFEGEEPVYVEPPKDHADYGKFLWLLRKNMYGLKRAPRLWERHLNNNVLRAMGYKPSIFDGIYVRYTPDGRIDGILFIWVDDIFALSGVTKAVTLLHELGSKIELTIKGVPTHFIGMDIDVRSDVIVFHQAAYASELLAVHGIDVDGISVPTNPLPIDIAKEYDRIKDKSPLLNKERTTEYRSLLGSLAFLQHSRPDLCYAIAFFGWFSSAPTEEAWRLLVRCALYASVTCCTGIVFRVQPIETFKIDAYCDASFGKHAHTGFIVSVNGTPVLWRSGKQRCVALSTVKAELRALYDCMDALILVMYMFSQFHVKCSVRAFSDAKDLVSLISSPHPKPAEKHLLIELRRLQALVDGDVGSRVGRLHGISERRIDREVSECVRHVLAINELSAYMPSMPIAVSHIPGASNPADVLTKSVDVRYLASKFLHTF